MAISFVKREERKEKINFTTPLFWNLIYFLVFLLVFLGILKLYNKIVDGKIKQTKIKIQELDQKKDIKIENEMKVLLENFQRTMPIISNHSDPTKILNFLEGVRHEKVNFSNINYNFSEGSITLNLSSSLPQYIIEQEKILQSKKDMISKVEEEGSPSLSVGAISVNIKIIFNKNLIHF